MTKSELTEIIRNVVREEIRTQLPDVLVEIFAQPSTKKQISESVTRTPQPRQVVQNTQRQSTPKIVTKNPALNAIFAETQGGIPVESDVQSVLDSPLLVENQEVAAVQQVFQKDFRGMVRAMDKVKSKGASPLGFQANMSTSFEQDPV